MLDQKELNKRMINIIDSMNTSLKHTDRMLERMRKGMILVLIIQGALAITLLTYIGYNAQ